MAHAMIYVVRHGQTDENINGIIQGQLDTLLNQVGIDQAQRVGEALKCVQFDLVYSSDLKRAYDTAQLVVKYHKNVPIHPSELLRERHMGELQGKVYSKSRSKASDATVEKTESFTKRILDFWDGVLVPELGRRFEENQGGVVNVLIVSHGAFISSVTRDLIQARGMNDERNNDERNLSNIHSCPNAGLTLYELQDDSITLLKFGDTSYLDASIISLGNSDEL